MFTRANGGWNIELDTHPTRTVKLKIDAGQAGKAVATMEPEDARALSRALAHYADIADDRVRPHA